MPEDDKGTEQMPMKSGMDIHVPQIMNPKFYSDQSFDLVLLYNQVGNNEMNSCIVYILKCLFLQLSVWIAMKHSYSHMINYSH